MSSQIKENNFSAPSLGVVTVLFNSELFIEEFIDCCIAQTFDGFKLLVIDNNSLDKSVLTIQSYKDPRIKLLLNDKNIGYAKACNQAIDFFKEMGVTDILFINNDTFFDKTLFFDLLEARKYNHVDAVTARITYASDPERNWYAGGKFNYWRGFQGQHLGEGELNDPTDNVPRLTPVASGCCVLFSIDIFAEVGYFDPNFFVYAEDTDLFIRMQKKRKKLLYHPEIVVKHKISLSTGGPQSDFSIRYHHRNQIYLIRKHLSSLSILLQIILIGCKIFLRLMLRLDTVRQCRLRINGMIEGFKI